MGKFDYTISDDFMNQLQKLSNIKDVALKMLDESAPILERHVKRECSAHRSTGFMVDSVKKTKAGVSKTGKYNVVVRPTGKGKDGIRNMEKMAWLEYGTKHREPKPILTKAVKDSEPEVLNKMQEVFEREAKV